MTNQKVAERFAMLYTSGKSGSMFIEDNTIYSYGYHFKIAKRISSNKFEVNTDKYSRTTSIHQTLVKRELENIGAELIYKSLK